MSHMLAIAKPFRYSHTRPPASLTIAMRCTEVITSLMTLLERMAAAAPDPGAVVEDLSEFFGPLLFRPPDAAAKPSAQQTDSPLVAVRICHPSASVEALQRKEKLTLGYMTGSRASRWHDTNATLAMLCRCIACR